MEPWEPPDLVLRRKALAEGWSDDELSRRIRRGEPTRVRPGACVPPSLGSADLAWEQVRVVGEFDGRVEYGRLLRPGQDPGDAVFEERLREDAIRDRDLGVVRWIWRELTPQVLGPRVHRALERGRRRRA